MLNLKQIKSCVVVLNEDSARGKRLAAYITTSLTSLPLRDLINNIRKDLSGVLPNHMTPSFFVVMEQLPLTENGKINKSTLPDVEINLTLDEYVEPVNSEEEIMVETLGKTLNLSRKEISMNANFFDIGGSSLLLLNVINELHKQGVEKTIKQFYEHTTLRAICADTIANNITDSQSVMVKLNRSVSGTPLYLVHPFRGRVDCYSVLAKHLEDVCPVYGLQAPYVAGENFDFSDLTQLASYYTSAILANQPDGPYRIAGWSVGGVIAQKVIERLSIMDRQVDYFAGIDCMMINPGVEELSHFESLKKIVGFIINEKYQRNEKNEIIESVCPEDIRALTLEQQLATSAKQLIEKLYAQHSDRRQLIARLKYGVNLLSAKVSLSSVSISGNAVLFVASENLKKELQIKGWKKAISSTSNVIEVDGKHWDILEGESFIQIKNKILADLSPSY